MGPLQRTLLQFSKLQSQSKTGQNNIIAARLKDNVSLFSRLYIVARSKRMWYGYIFQHHFFHEEDSNPSNIYDVVLDGAAVVHFLPTVDIATFDEYADCVFLLHITKLLNNAFCVSSYKIEEGKGCMMESCG